MQVTTVAQRVRSSTDHGWLETVGRVGLVGRGLLHGIVALLALTVAHGHANRRADSEGALASIAHQPFGRVLVLAVGVGLAAYAVWSLATIVRHDNGRLVAAGRAVVYSVLSVLAFSLVFGGGGGAGSNQQASAGSGGGKEAGITARLLHWPAGRIIVIAIGLAVIGGGIANAWKIRHRKWADGTDLECRSLATQRTVGALAGVGLAARAGAFALVGVFLVLAGWRYDPKQATGLDGALKRLAASPHGPALLTLFALGLIAYGVWCVAMATLHPNGRA